MRAIKSIHINTIKKLLQTGSRRINCNEIEIYTSIDHFVPWINRRFFSTNNYKN